MVKDMPATTPVTEVPPAGVLHKLPRSVIAYVPLHVPPAVAVEVNVKVLAVALVTDTPVPKQLAPPPVTSMMSPTAKPCPVLVTVTLVLGDTVSFTSVLEE